MQERWRDVPEYEGLYAVSQLGRVRSLPRYKVNGISGVLLMKGRVLAPVTTREGYSRVCLMKNGKRKNFAIHRLVALAFLPNPENKPTVNHIDGNKLNNRLNNLEWATYSENEQHSYAVLSKQSHKAIPIKQLTLDGQLIKVWDSALQAAKALGLHDPNINKCCKGIRNQCGGFKWEYLIEYGIQLPLPHESLLEA